MNTKPHLESTGSLPSFEIALLGTDGTYLIRLRSPNGPELIFNTLTGLVSFLREQRDAGYALVANAIALGAALHCTQRYDQGIFLALDEAATALRGLPAMQILIRLERCADRHESLLTQKEIAARLVMEAGRIVKENNGVGRAKTFVSMKRGIQKKS